MIEPYYDHNGITIYHGDCLEVLPFLKDIDFVYTDPPYNARKGYGPGKDNLPDKEYLERMKRTYNFIIKISPKWITHIPKKYKHEFFYDILPRDTQEIIIPARARNGFCFPFLWIDKYDILGAYGQPFHAPPNLWDNIRLKGEGYFFKENDFGHFGYTPRPICHRAIKYMLQEKSVILDPFVGTGTTLIEAISTGHRAIGIEIEEKYVKIAIDRLSQEVLPFKYEEPRKEIQSSILEEI